MWLMLQQDSPDDYIIATGETHSVKEFIEKALECAGLEQNIEKYVEFDKEMIRPAEVDLLIGDASKARRFLGWKPQVDFVNLIELMVENDLRIENKT
jgi:GDPmannose 4,6-dehydratase